jgi:hypothetical protein
MVDLIWWRSAARHLLGLLKIKRHGRRCVRSVGCRAAVSANGIKIKKNRSVDRYLKDYNTNNYIA